MDEDNINPIAYWRFIPRVQSGGRAESDPQLILSPLVIFTRGRDKFLLLPSSVQVGKFSASPIGNRDWSYNHCETHPPGQVNCKYPGS